MKQTFPINPGDTSVTVETLTVFTGSATPPPPTNKIPVVKAGVDQAIVLPTNSVNLTGSATDPDTGGTISAYLWEKRSGSGEIESPNSQNTKITGLQAGSSVFRLSAIDNTGASGFDDVIINVSATTPPVPPAGYTVTYRNGFDKPTDLTDNNGQYGNGFVTTAAGTFVTGPGAFRSRPANVSNGCRSEWQSGSNSQNPSEGAIEYDCKYDYIVQGNCHSLQWHPSTGGGSASPGLWHEGGKFVWYNWKNGGNSRYATGFTIPKGKWMHFRVEYKFGGSGYIRHFVDGVKIFEKTGIQVGDDSGFYLKLGFNGNFDGNLSEATKSDITYDNLVIYKKS